MKAFFDLRPGDGLTTLGSGALLFLVVGSHYLISPPEAIYVIVEGEIRATRDGEDAWVVRRGEAISSLPVLDRKPTLVTATAVGPARVLFVEDAVFNDLMLDSPALPLGIVRFLAGEVRRLLLERPRAEVPAYT